MEVLYPRCAGLDVHAKSVVACVRIASGATVGYAHRTVATSTRALLELAEWLTAQGVTHVAMEATGVYWKPVWHVLEDHVTLVLANAMHIRNIPGRKSDKNDATWIADLLALGLIRSSFVPPAPIQELRDLTRTRKQLVREITRHTQRIQKTLEDANLKLTETISNILGTSGRAILNALVAGETDPARLADLAHGRLKATRGQLLDVLHGRIPPHHRFMIQLHLSQITALETAVADLEARIGEALGPFRAAVSLLTPMPGLKDTAAAVVVAEIGTDMSQFPSAGHLLSWAGLCPRLDESAGKRRSTRTRQGAPWLKTTLVQVAWTAARKKDIRRNVPAAARIRARRPDWAWKQDRREEQGVVPFTLLLSPDQFDLNRAITVVVNGRTVFDGIVQRDVRTLLKWAARDNDRTMLFAAETAGRSAAISLTLARRCRQRSWCRRAS